VVAVKVHAELFAAALSKRAIMEAWEGGKDGDLQTQRRGDKRLPERWVDHAQGGVRDRGFVFLWHVKLALLLETRACVALTQGLEGRPMLGELLRDTLLGN
jgi:hypothetical protein